MNFPWYSTDINSEDITQGDLIFNVPIPIINTAVYKAISKNVEGIEVEDPIEIAEADVIIVSQACDIENGKIDSIIVCPVSALTQVMTTGPAFKASKWREDLRRGKEPAFHLLNKHSIKELDFPFSVVDFHQIFSLPKDYILEVIKVQKTRLRLQPPYREHLSQAFARYFMRVGLPSDIDSNLIKALNPAEK
jgi:hypothetical protein